MSPLVGSGCKASQRLHEEAIAPRTKAAAKATPLEGVQHRRQRLLRVLAPSRTAAAAKPAAFSHSGGFIAIIGGDAGFDNTLTHTKVVRDARKGDRKLFVENHDNMRVGVGPRGGSVWACPARGAA